MQGFRFAAISVDGRRDERTHARTDGRTEIWTPISHPAISRCDNKNSAEVDIAPASGKVNRP